MSTLAVTPSSTSPSTEEPPSATRVNRFYFFNDPALKRGIERLLAGVVQDGDESHLTLKGPAGEHTASFEDTEFPTYSQIRKAATNPDGPDEKPGFALREHVLDALSTAAARSAENLEFRALIVFDTKAELWPLGGGSTDTVARSIAEHADVIDKAVASGTLDFQLTIIGLSGTRGTIGLLLKKHFERLPQNSVLRGSSVEDFLRNPGV